MMYCDDLINFLYYLHWQVKIFLCTTSRDDKILLWHKTINFKFDDLNAIFNTTDETFQNDGINHVSKCIGALSDGCNANDGVHSEVTNKLLEKIPQFQAFVRLNSHHVCNSCEHQVIS